MIYISLFLFLDDRDLQNNEVDMENAVSVQITQPDQIHTFGLTGHRPESPPEEYVSLDSLDSKGSQRVTVSQK